MTENIPVRKRRAFSLPVFGMEKRMQEAGVSRKQLHLSAYGTTADAGKLSAHLRAGKNK